MVVLTIVTNTNGETINFQEAIPKVDFMKVVYCSLYKKRGTATMTHKTNPPDAAPFRPGYYNLESLAKEMKRMFAKDDNYMFNTETNTPVCQLIIKNSAKRSVKFDENLTALLGVDAVMAERFAKINPSFPTTYFIHCDLIDKQKNLLNGEMSEIGWFDIKGAPHEKVYYSATAQQALRPCRTSDTVHGITISVKDGGGKLFDFKDFPLEFELELI